MEGVHNPHDDFVNQQWVEIGTLHHQQQHHHYHQQAQHHAQNGGHPHHDFAAYGLVESPGFVPQDHQQQQFRMQQHQQQPVPIAPNYLGLPHWGQTMIPPQPSGVSSSHAQFIPSPAIAAPNQPTLGAPLSVAQSGHSTQSTSSPRRTLTDADRRRMCMFHEENPNVKQTEIGGMVMISSPFVHKGFVSDCFS